MIHQFTFDDLGVLDGGALKMAIEEKLAECVRDCMNRPLETKARTVTLGLKITPVVSGRDIERVEVAFVVSHKTPPIAPRAFTMEPTYKGGLKFNDMSPDNPQQETLDKILDNPGRPNGD